MALLLGALFFLIPGLLGLAGTIGGVWFLFRQFT